ncbi:MAG TPA: nutrient deprivation-induced protein [Devosia sp.]|nr:nutrient deprivation-induced protein [Devosia sp.]
MSDQDANDSNAAKSGDSTGSGLNSNQLQQEPQTEFGTATEALKDSLDTVRQHAGEDVESVKAEAKSQIGAATDKAKGFAGEQKDMVATQLGGIAAAITKVADELQQTDQAAVASYARDLANGVGKFADTVQNKNVDDLMGMAEGFGRKQPVAFLGVAALAGFVASRFALASAHRRDTTNATTVTPAATGGDNVQQ